MKLNTLTVSVEIVRSANYQSARCGASAEVQVEPNEDKCEVFGKVRKWLTAQCTEQADEMIAAITGATQ